jgi:hypothetical protein
MKLLAHKAHIEVCRNSFNLFVASWCRVMFVERAQGKAGHNKSHSFPSFTSLLPKR